MTKGVCLFCQQYRTLTGEHTFSDWINRLYPAMRGYTFTQTSPDGDTQQWKSKYINQKLRLPCEECNNGWMSSVESAARDILKDMVNYRGGSISIPVERIAALAAFTFLKAVVLDHAPMVAKDKSPFFAPSIREKFLHTRELPNGVYMWLAACHSRQAAHTGLLRTVYHKQRMLGFKDFIFTLAFGWVVLQLVAFRPVRHSRTPLTFPRPHEGAEWRGSTIEFWPLCDCGPLAWPPRKLLSDGTLTQFACRWNRATCNVLPRLSRPIFAPHWSTPQTVR